MVRLGLIFAPAAAILTGIGLTYTLDATVYKAKASNDASSQTYACRKKTL